MQGFNHDILEWFNTSFYNEWVMLKQPHDAASLARLMKPFSMCGLSVAVCNRDGVHIATYRAKSKQRYLMTGKEGYPTWAYDYTVSHSMQFLEVHGPFRGATNDKTMVRDKKYILPTELRVVYFTVQMAGD